jgi:hypothetical protein
VEDHLAHSDMLGGCQFTNNSSADQLSVVQGKLGELSIKAYPNPTQNFFTIQVQGGQHASALSLRVLDLTGRSIEQHRLQSQSSVVRIGQALPKGIYFVEISNGAQKTTIKLVKQ